MPSKRAFHPLQPNLPFQKTAHFWLQLTTQEGGETELRDDQDDDNDKKELGDYDDDPYDKDGYADHDDHDDHDE